MELEPSRTAEALTRFQRHGEFELVGLSVSQRVHQSATDAGGASTTPPGSSDDGGGLGAPAAHRDVTYSVRLRRRPGFHLFHLVLPCLLVNALALLSFFVPCESGEKVTLGINTLLCVAVFLVVVRDSLPPGGTMLPLISECALCPWLASTSQQRPLRQSGCSACGPKTVMKTLSSASSGRQGCACCTSGNLRASSRLLRASHLC